MENEKGKELYTKNAYSDGGDKMSTAWPFDPTPQGEGPGAGPGFPC